MDTEISISKNNQNNKSFLVYKHTNLTNGKVYIGITNRSPEERWKQGKAYKSNEHFTSAINKYGWDGFSHEIVKRGLTKEEALLLEESLIKEYDSTNRDKGYNILLSSIENHPRFTEDSKIKMSESRKEYFRNMSDEEYERYCCRCKEASSTEEYRNRVSNRMTEYYKNIENREVMSKRKKEIYNSYSEEEKESFREKCKEIMSDEHLRKRISDSLKNYYKNLSEDELQNLRNRTRKSLSNPETRKKMSDSQKIYNESLTEEQRENKRLIAKKSSNRPEVKEKLKKSLKNYRDNLTEERKEELRQKTIKAHASDDYRKRVSESVKKVYKDNPDLRDTISRRTKEAMSSPEVREKFMRALNSPEYLDRKKKLKEDFEKQKEELYPNHIKWNQYQKLWFEQNNKNNRG